MSLRIISEGSARNLERGLQTGRDVGDSLQDTYMSRLTKLVPGEAIAAYPLFLNTVPKVGDSRPWQAVLVIVAVLLIVVLVLRWRATKSADGRAQWPAVFLSGVSFLIWVAAMGPDLGFTGLSIMSIEVPGVSTELLSALLLFAWTAITPAVYTGDTA
jgi:hypothetical protein